MATTPRGMPVAEAYSAFRKNHFRVDRTYQRKLVWTLDEKKALIDSMRRGYPIPLVLLLSNALGGYDIIDGMQRLNAIFSFIENQFPLADGRFFDVAEYPTAKEHAAAGLFDAYGGEDKLSRAECAELLNYQLAVTIFSVNDSSDVTEVFGRINSGGKQLSSQERRQAGVVSQFSVFVRRLGCELRGDVSDDVVNLADMPSVSVEAPSLKLGYGVRAQDTFWCRQGILQAKELRDSGDEQLVADLAASILLDGPFAVSRENLDDAYTPGTARFADLNDRIASYSEERLGLEIRTTLSVVRETIEKVDSSPNVLRKTVNPKARGNPIRTPFFAVFMAFHELIVNQHKQPTDAHGIMTALKGLAAKLETASHHVRTVDRKKNVDVTLGLIQQYFSPVDPPLLGHGPGLAIDFVNSLRRSQIETPRYEFKQGLCRLSPDRQRDKKLPERLAEVACSIANIGPGVTGYLFIGVADSEEDAARVSAMDGIEPLEIGKFRVVGIAREAKLTGVTIEQYVREFVGQLRATALSEPLKSDLLGNVDTIDYRGLTVLRITVPPQAEVSWVGESTFVREGSETHPASAKQAAALTAKFALRP